ncbi:putative MFS transporter [Xylona heveae TC161]|uniref:Putative MFS transporter n=1 Tax=Xylona heveae (strain CBS 132557 / TC161) TaxID=1328760 RepID=A0A165GNT9_XYLHT|nr:putative MFS transporter [Xylona heveae TC161]KZF22414.1 putative MFS transporter [Xylona heveae TC161]
MGFIHKSQPNPAASDRRVSEEDKKFEAIQLENVATTQDSAHREAVDPLAEKKVVRKMDWRIPPLLGALYLLSFLDRSNIGNARIAGMEDDLSLTGDRYDWLLTIFYISYIVFEFQTMMWKILPPHIWAGITILAWGLIATLQSTVQNWQGLMACRFFLGLAEAGFGPGVPYLLSFFYLRKELGLRVGMFLSAAPLANCFAGALAYGITSGHSKLANWRLLFLVEGIPTILMAPVAYFFLPDSPDKARFLTTEEKQIAKERGVRQVGATERVGGVNFKEIGLALVDVKCWFTALMYFSCNVSFSSLPVFLPTILSQMGFTKIDAQGLTAPPYFLSFLITIFSTWVADRTKQRGITIILLSCIGGVGYIILGSTRTTGPRYFGVFLAAAGIFPAIANIIPWVLNNQGSDNRRGAGIVLLNLVGQCGPLLGTRLYPTSEAPNYEKGHYVCAAFMFFTGLLALGLRTLLWWENRKLDRTHGALPPPPAHDTETGTKTAVAQENYGPTFRFVL